MLLTSDPRVQDWPLMATPGPIVTIFFMYLVTITQGPKLMASQKSMELSALIFIYNVGLVCLSAYMFYEVRGMGINNSVDVYVIMQRKVNTSRIRSKQLLGTQCFICL